MRTVQDWLAIPKNKLPTALAEVLTPGPWKHATITWRAKGGCTQFACKKCNSGKVDTPCPIPDPIKIDWNTAMEWRDKIAADMVNWELWIGCMLELVDDTDIIHWLLVCAQPKHYLIAAALAMGRKEE